MSITDHQPTPHNIPEERKPELSVQLCIRNVSNPTADPKTAVLTEDFCSFQTNAVTVTGRQHTVTSYFISHTGHRISVRAHWSASDGRSARIENILRVNSYVSSHTDPQRSAAIPSPILRAEYLSVRPARPPDSAVKVSYCLAQ